MHICAVDAASACVDILTTSLVLGCLLFVAAVCVQQVEWDTEPTFNSSRFGQQVNTPMFFDSPQSVATYYNCTVPAGSLIKGLPYYLRVRARNERGWGPYSSVLPETLVPRKQVRTPSQSLVLRL